MAHDKLKARANVIAINYEQRTLNGFSTKLMDAIIHADLQNRAKFGTCFPEYVLAYHLWYRQEFDTKGM